MADYLRLTSENLAQQHICCALSGKTDGEGVLAKKEWLRARFADGLVFLKLNARGKVFIEYLPAEHAWAPVVAPHQMYINCFWVSGSYKKQGHGAALLAQCIADAKAAGMQGVTVLSAAKKKPFLSDGAYLKRKGFVVADTTETGYELLWLPLAEGTPPPQFHPAAKRGETDLPGLVLYYTAQCPHTAFYAPLLGQLAAQQGVPVTLCKLQSAAEAQRAPAPFTTYSLFWQGRFLTNEILSPTKIEALLQTLKAER